MDATHPNRKKDKLNPYTLSIEHGDYYISFSDVQGFHKIKISAELYSAFNSFELEDISQQNVESRHMEHSDLTEETLNRRAVDTLEPLENQVFRKIMYQKLHNAIGELPDKQRRRLLLYYFGGYTYEQIADMESCKHPAIMKSVAAAERNIKKYLSKQG